MRIWIDNDGCPRPVREVVLKAAERRSVAVVVVGNSFMRLPPSPLFRMQVVSGAFDAADHYIIEHVAAGDMVVTADIPLAAQIVAKDAKAVTPRGQVIEAHNAGELLATRNLLSELRGAGEVQGGPAAYGEGDKKRFANAFDRLLTSLMS